jgi:RNA-directed DNA polymerase
VRAGGGWLPAIDKRVFSRRVGVPRRGLCEGLSSASANREQRGLGKPETFNFLGFAFMCGKSRQGFFLLKRKTRRDRMRTKLRMVKQEMRRRMHQPIPEQGRWLWHVVRGYFNYHAVPMNTRALPVFRAELGIELSPKLLALADEVIE